MEMDEEAERRQHIQLYLYTVYIYRNKSIINILCFIINKKTVMKKEKKIPIFYFIFFNALRPI